MNSVKLLFNFTVCLPFIFKQTSSCSTKIFSLLKQCKQYLQKYFLFLFFVLLNIKSFKIFYVHIMWFNFISYYQKIYWTPKFLIWYVNRISKFVFITKNIHTSFVFHFNFIKIIFRYRKFNSFTIKSIDLFFILLCNSFWMSF